jgi:hypothetical protein
MRDDMTTGGDASIVESRLMTGIAAVLVLLSAVLTADDLTASDFMQSRSSG